VGKTIRAEIQGGAFLRLLLDLTRSGKLSSEDDVVLENGGTLAVFSPYGTFKGEVDIWDETGPTIFHPARDDSAFDLRRTERRINDLKYDANAFGRVVHPSIQALVDEEKR
jgi:hypothetical protein